MFVLILPTLNEQNRKKKFLMQQHILQQLMNFKAPHAYRSN